MNTQITTKMKINKPSNEVFEAIVDPKEIGNFWFTSSSERWDAGKAITLRYDEYEAEGVINVLEIKEGDKIVFSWGGESDETTVVSITLRKFDDTITIIEVTETGLKEDDPEIIDKMLGQKEGWVYVLSCLKAYLEYGICDLRASLVH